MGTAAAGVGMWAVHKLLTQKTPVGSGSIRPTSDAVPFTPTYPQNQALTLKIKGLVDRNLKTELFLQQLKSGEKGSWKLTNILQASRPAQILDDVLTLAKQEMGKFWEPAVFADEAGTGLEIVYQGSRGRVELHFSDGAFELYTVDRAEPAQNRVEPFESFPLVRLAESLRWISSS